MVGLCGRNVNGNLGKLVARGDIDRPCGAWSRGSSDSGRPARAVEEAW